MKSNFFPCNQECELPSARASPGWQFEATGHNLAHEA